MLIFQMQDSVTLRKAGQSLFNKTWPCGFHASNMCGKVYTFVCIHLQHKALPIIITNNMWIKGQTGDGMATFLIENKINSRINVTCFYFWSLVCQILIIWGMDHVGTWFCKRCVWNLTYWVQFRSCQARAKNDMKGIHVKLCDDDCLI